MKPVVKPLNTESVVEVSEADLPLSCPTHNMSLWNAHPKVFIQLDAEGRGKCPYCGTEFKKS